MKLAGDYILDAPRELVWRALLDPDVLSKTLPGCEELKEVGENQYEGRLKMKVGPVQGVFEGKVQLSELVPPQSYNITIDGKGAPGFMTGKGSLTLEEDPGGTKLTYDIDAKVGGRIASIGQRLVESSAKVISKQGLKGLDKQVQELKSTVEDLASETPDEPMSEPEAEAVLQSVASPAQAESAQPTPTPVGSPQESGAEESAAAAASGQSPETTTAAPSGRTFPLFIGLALLALAAFFVYQRACV